MNNKCRFCATSIEPFMSFGKMPHASGFLDQSEFDREYFYELQPALCEGCKLFQIIDVPDPSKTFHLNYPHITSTSQYVVNHFKELAQLVNERYLKETNSFVIELGSNDGSFLKNFVEWKIKHLGIEPASSVAELGIKEGVNTITEFFSHELAKKIQTRYGRANVVFGANVIAHIPDIRDVANGIVELLKDEGVFIFEAVYLGDLISNTSYSQIYDEHVYNFSVESVKNIFSECGLELFNVERLSLQGGSLRYFLGFSGKHEIQASVKSMEESENIKELNQPETMTKFRTRCELSRSNLFDLIENLHDQGKRVVGYGAATKSTIILNYARIKRFTIEYMVDSTPYKQDKYSPGIHIPIKSPGYFRENFPDYVVVFPWNHFEEIRSKENAYSESKGRWILPFLKPEIRS